MPSGSPFNSVASSSPNGNPAPPNSIAPSPCPILAPYPSLGSCLVSGGIVTASDLNNYQAELIEQPLSISLGDSQLYAPSAPLSGPVLALILNILKGCRTMAVLSGQALRGD